MVSEVGTSYYLNVFLGYGNGDFRMQTILLCESEGYSYYFHATTGDLNNDGYLDFIYWTRLSNIVNIILNKPVF